MNIYWILLITSIPVTIGCLAVSILLLRESLKDNKRLQGS